MDELSSCVGVAHAACQAAASALTPLPDQLVAVMCALQDAGAALATPRNTGEALARRVERTAFPAAYATTLEAWIDAMDATLPPLTAFILPGGTPAAASLHHARAVCRRAERRVVGLVRSGVAERDVAVFLNRLSDYLFTAARAACRAEGQRELMYRTLSHTMAAAPMDR